jgi:hypothetical protein
VILLIDRKLYRKTTVMTIMMIFRALL